MQSPDSKTLTNDRLLKAASEVFADKGFEAATIREICQKAGTNVASVNYHFGDKETLYQEVFLKSVNKFMEEREVPDTQSSPEEQLKRFIFNLLSGIHQKTRTSPVPRFMLHETLKRTNAFEIAIENLIHPMIENLSNLVKTIAPRLNETQIRNCILSIIAQCVYFGHSQPNFEDYFPANPKGLNDLEMLSNHIYQFTHAAIKGFETS